MNKTYTMTSQHGWGRCSHPWNEELEAKIKQQLRGGNQSSPVRKRNRLANPKQSVLNTDMHATVNELIDLSMCIHTCMCAYINKIINKRSRLGEGVGGRTREELKGVKTMQTVLVRGILKTNLKY